MSIEVRRARAEEYAAVAALTERAFAAGAYGPSTDPARIALLRDAAGRDRDGVLLVAVEADVLLGTLTLVTAASPLARQAGPGEDEVRLLAVDPAAQGRGVGAALVAAALDLSRAAGADAVVLDTGPRNDVSQRLYQRLGFARVTARETRPAAHGGRLVVFRYDLRATAPVVRLVAPHEHDAVAALSVAAYTADGPVSEQYRANIADVASRAREHEVWVAQDRTTGALLGTVATPRPGGHLSELARDDELDFRLLAVAPDAQRRGIGELLTNHVLELARQRGARRVVMNSGPRMLAAHRLYHRLGFVRLPEREDRVVEGGTLLAFGYEVAVPTTAVPVPQGASA